nr:AAA family ATPase [Mitsuokella multacida]
MADLINRKVINTTLSKDNAEKLRTLSKRKGIPQTRVLDRAVDTLYQKEEASMEGATKHKGIAICVANNKGGVGKTTSTAAFADLLSKRGKRVLVIDADPQGNLSGRFGYSADSPEQAIPNYLGSLIEDRFRGTEHQPLGYFISHLDEFPRIDIIYSDIRLDGVYTLLTTDSIASATMFRKLLTEIRSLDKYDYILIDARPAVNNEVSSIFIGSDYVIIPVEASWDSIVGANTIYQFMAKSRELNPDLKLLGVFFTKVQDRTTSFHTLLPMVKGNWDKDLFQTKVPRNQDVVNAENEGYPVTYRKPACKASKAYVKLLDEMVEQIEHDEKQND